MNRHAKHLPALYIVDLLVFTLGLCIIVFALYITPNVLFGLDYRVPFFIARISEYFLDHHDLAGYALVTVVLLPFYIVGAIFLFLSRQATVQLDIDECDINMLALEKENELLVKKEATFATRLPTEKKYKINPVIVYLLVVLLAIAFLIFIEWLITFDYDTLAAIVFKTHII